MTDLFDAIKMQWRPVPESLGAAAREVLGCFSWSGKQGAIQMAEYIYRNLEP